MTTVQSTEQMLRSRVELPISYHGSSMPTRDPGARLCLRNAAALMVVAASICSPHTASGQSYKVLIVPKMLDGVTTNDVAYRINSAHQVSGNFGPVGFEWRGFLYEIASGTMVVGTYFENRFGGSQVWCLNNSGVMGGSSAVPSGGCVRAILTASGSPMTLVPLPWLPSGGIGVVRGINENGTSVGYAGRLPVCSYPFESQDPAVPVKWVGAAVIELTGIGGFAGVATDINDSGSIVGFDMFTGINSADFTNTRAWVIPVGSSSAIALPTLGGTKSRVFSIDESGRMLGFAEDAEGGLVAVRWDSPTSVTSLGLLSGYEQSFALRATADGEFAVGHAAGGIGNPDGAFFNRSDVFVYGHLGVIFAHGKVIDLNTRIEPIAGLRMNNAFDISPEGYIVGSAWLEGDQRPVVLVPCAPLVIEEPQSQLFCGPGPVSFTVGTAPFGEPGSFIWRRNGAPIQQDARIVIELSSDGRSSTLTIINTAASDVGSYDVLMSNGCGASLSEPATLASSVSPPTLPGDANGDGVVSFADITQVLSSFGDSCR